jgi:antitoxin (DNA-binding transcriptional repressor) of toxin-antitoxin stability system
MKKVSKSSVKAKMFEYFRELEEHGGELIVTDFGKPVLKITPCSKGTGIDELFKDLRAKARISRRAAIEDTSDEWSQQ